MNITCIGGGGHVTGAQYLLETDVTELFLVECGFFQEGEVDEVSFPYDPADIKALFLTHAHIDHSGLIPLLVKRGFKGPIYATAPTRQIASLLLSDMVKVMTYKEKKGEGAVLYKEEDVMRAMKQFKEIEYGEDFEVGSLKLKAYNAGHVLGSASFLIEETSSGKKVAFSGDLGNIPSVLLQKTQYIKEADVAFIESAYGGRLHESVGARGDLLKQALYDVEKRGGALLIPSFAFDRTQEILFEMNDFFENNKVPPLPVYVDSPLAIAITEVYEQYVSHPHFFNPGVKDVLRIDSDVFSFSNLSLIRSSEDSEKIKGEGGAKVIVAGAGMSEGGRIRSHYQTHLSDPRNILLFVGFQSRGTLGRALLDGVSPIILEGKEIEVRAERRVIRGYSAHADQKLLLCWIEAMKDSVSRVIVVQGEKEQSQELANRIKEQFQISSEVGEKDSVYRI